MSKYIEKYGFMSLIVCFCCIISSCSKKVAYPETAEVSFVSSPQSGVIELSAMGYGRTQKEAELDIYTTAFNNLLFRGIPGFGELRQPFVDNERSSRTEHPGFYRKFFDERGYLRFVSGQSAAQKMGKPSDDKTKIRAKKNLTVNYESLRHYLEDEGIIRKFGF